MSIIVLSTLIKLAGFLVVLSLGYALLRALIRALVSFLNEAVDMLVALFFFCVIVPPLWLWNKSKRPMWRTLTKEQTRDLEAWLRRASRG